LKIFFLLFLFLNLLGEDNFSFRIGYGKVTKSDFGEILLSDIQPHEENLKVLSFDGGYLLQQGDSEIPIDIYIKSGMSRFDENGLQDDLYELTLYIKLYYNLDFLGNRIRLGLGEGGSYTSAILYSEYIEAQSDNPPDNNSKYLNYIDLSLDLDIGRLTHYKPLYDSHIGWALKHRSGVFGLINNVVQGGSNYNIFYIESKF